LSQKLQLVAFFSPLLQHFLQNPATQPIPSLLVRYDGGYTPAMFAYMRLRA
jgi:hypothetical protein